MNAFVDAVRDRVPAGCRRRSCCKGKCSVPIPRSMHPFLLIDLDDRLIDPDDPGAPAGEAGGRCDYLFIGSEKNPMGGEENLVAPLELKAGRPRASTAVKQLQAGARIAEKLIPNDGARIAFRPVVVSKGMNKRERGEFAKKKNKIRFRNERSLATLHKCGKPLDQANWQAQAE